MRSFIGMGYNDNHTPGVILRNMVQNPGWYTAYTPYQAEISQGRLEMLLNFQTMICELTGLPIANASLLDEGSSAAEALSMCHAQLKGKRKKVLVSDRCHPQTIGCVTTRMEALGIEVVVADVHGADEALLGECSGVLVQYPDTYGRIDDFKAIADAAHAKKTLVVAAADPLALNLYAPPAEWGADIVCGSAQRYGVPLFFGGPHAGYLACTEKLKRKLPGRIIGVSRDVTGKPCVRLAMQAREQHIRRDKATSNICTAQALLANVAAAYAIYHGPEGLKEIAARTAKITAKVAGLVNEHTAYTVEAGVRFDTIRIDDVADASAVVARAVEAGINFRVISDTSVGISFDETTNLDDVRGVLGALGVDAALAEGDDAATAAAEGTWNRTGSMMQQSVFSKYHSETEMMRYLHALERKDLALNMAAIPLGSCTMKLNAVSEMEPVTWSEFADIHPFAPENQWPGYAKMIDELNTWLCEITGFAAVSTQPNSGATGEYAGLLAIRKYQETQGQGHRTICLIPTSAHGTNPASAVMCGMEIKPVKNLPSGAIDMDDVRAKVEKYKDDLACIMLTYPSTYGVFDEGPEELCELIHSNGGQVYMDGANMNAQVGLTSPGHIGADVCHLNLHKTFCIPHGGGGPGVGSIGVAAHLAPHLPGHTVLPTGGEGPGDTVAKTTGAVAAAPFGSAGILPISWMYIRMLGEPGLKQATEMAILNANYMASRLGEHYPVAFTGTNGQCAHEFIMDVREFSK